MADALITDEEISILCDVLEGQGANFSASKRNVLDQLIVKGFVTASDQGLSANYKLTSKAQQLLAERGVVLTAAKTFRDRSRDAAIPRSCRRIRKCVLIG